MTVATRALFTGEVAGAEPRAPVALTSAPAGGWTWFNDPRAIYRDGYTYFGYQRGSDGSVVIAVWDHGADAIATTTVLHSALELDDHDNPGLIIRASDDKLMAFYAKHATTTAPYYRVSTNSVTSDPTLSGGFAAEVNLTPVLGSGALFTYAMPIQLSGESGNPIRYFYRTHIGGTEPELTYNRTDDDGATWAAVVSLHDLTYTKIAQTTDQIHFFCSQHPGDITGPATKLYHFYLDTAGTPAWRKSDGTALVSPSFPLQTTDMTEVYDGGSTRVWVHDIAMDGTTPVVVFATFPSTTDHRYRYGRWNGSAWVTTQIAPAGTYIVTDLSHDANQVYYSGGVSFDQSDPATVYASRETATGFELFRYVTLDDGVTWRGAQLTADGAKYVRPVGVRGDGPFRYLAMKGTYNDYLDYSSATVGGV